MPPRFVVTEFQAAIQNGAPPKETPADMYPVYQINKNGPKYHFKWFVNAITDKDTYAVLLIFPENVRKYRSTRFEM